MPLVPVLARMEKRGVLIDVDNLKHQSQALGKRMLEIQKQAYAEAGREFNLDSPKQLQAILFDELELPVKVKTPQGRALDQRGGAGGDRRRPPAAAPDPGLPRPGQAALDLHRQAAGDGQPGHRPRAHQLPPGRGGDRAAVLVRSQPAEHPGAHRGRPAHPPGLRRARGLGGDGGRLFADRAAHHGPPVRRRGPAQGLQGGRRHPPRHRRRGVRRQARRRRHPTSAAPPRPSTSA